MTNGTAIELQYSPETLEQGLREPVQHCLVRKPQMKGTLGHLSRKAPSG